MEVKKVMKYVSDPYLKTKIREILKQPDHWFTKLVIDSQTPSIHDLVNLDPWAGMQFDESNCIRSVYTSLFGFPLVTKELLEDMEESINFLTGEDKSLLEIGSGTGYLAHNLREAGVNVVATDDFSWRGWISEPFTEIEKLDWKDAFNKYLDKTGCVLLSWPNYDTSLGYDVLSECVKHNIPMVYIGEGRWGCTGDDKFFDLIEEKCSMWRMTYRYMPFEGIHDNVYVIEKKG